MQFSLKRLMLAVTCFAAAAATLAHLMRSSVPDEAIARFVLLVAGFVGLGVY